MRRLLLLLGAATLLTAACDYLPADDGYQLVWSDEFDTLNTDVWYAGTDADNVTVQDGTLRIEAFPGDWTAIGSNGPRQPTEPNYPGQVAFQEGYFEARIRYTHNEWTWPIFWLWSAAKSEAHPGENCDLLTSEWDIMENGLDNSTGVNPAYSATHSVLHRNTADAAQPDGMYCETPDEMRMVHNDFPDVDLADWHVWAGRWEDDQLCTFLDGTEIGCMSTFDSTAQPMTLTFSVNVHGVCGGCGPRPERVELEVDWVRVWQKAG